jgi:uncharacterized repeat protein (TIGR01451 family)
MRFSSVNCAMVICCFGALSAVAQEIGYIDFSGLTVRESTRHPRTHGSACGSSPHSRPSRSQVKVTLLSLDKTIYQIGEELTFEVKVQNTGTAPLVIPWTPHFADLEPNDLRAPYKYLAGVVVVQFKDSKQHWFALSEALYGATDVPGTLLELRPGQWFTVRGRERIQILVPDWGRDQLNESSSVETRVTAGFREDLGTYSPRDGGSDTKQCVLVGPNEANELNVILAPN